MSQQQMNFDEMNNQQHEGSYNYQAGYRDPQDPFAGSSYSGQKISFGNSSSSASSGQRLALAIVSLCLLIPLVAIVTGAAFSAGFLGVIGGLIGIGLVCITVIAVNYFFNARH